MTDHDQLYIDGAWVAVQPAPSTIEVVNPSTEQVIGHVPDGTAADVDRAVAAAKAAFETWGQTSKEERGKYVQRHRRGPGRPQRGDRRGHLRRAGHAAHVAPT